MENETFEKLFSGRFPFWKELDASEKEAMLVAEGEIYRTPVVAVGQDFAFMGGSMGMYVGNAIIAALEAGQYVVRRG